MGKLKATFSTLSSSRKVKKQVDKKLPKVIENPKKMMVISGRKTSNTLKEALLDLHKLKRPHCLNMTRQSHDFLPFENVADLENFCKRYDCSHFMLGSHTKKRPNNITLGRLFNFQMLDMIEFGIKSFSGIGSSTGKKNMDEETNSSNLFSNNIGSKMCLLFQGDAFVNDERMKTVQNLFLDCFRGESDVKKINLLGLDHVMVVSALDEKSIHIGHYAIQFEKSGQQTPNVILHNIGPNMVLEIKRHFFAGVDLRREALKVPKVLTQKNKDMKNVFINELGDREAKVFVEQQEIGTIALRKTKALSKTEKAKAEDQERSDALAEKLLAKKRAFVQENQESSAAPATKKRKL